MLFSVVRLSVGALNRSGPSKLWAAAVSTDTDSHPASQPLEEEFAVVFRVLVARIVVQGLDYVYRPASFRR